ncbi:cytoplasmic protein [bacterium]|nr:cytoplasmic protein [bacterium]
MQTFLPLPSFKGSAKCLDNKRLGKQRVECKQILLCLDVPIGEHSPGKRGWQHHPAVLMWAGHEVALLVYAIVVCREWTSRGFQDRLQNEFVTAYTRLRPTIDVNRYPTWFGSRELHASHRSSLLRKDLRHYSQFGWDDPIYLPYFWPVQVAQEAT